MFAAKFGTVMQLNIQKETVISVNSSTVELSVITTVNDTSPPPIMKFIILLLIIGVTSTIHASPNKPRGAKSHSRTMSICANQKVPSGWVIIRYANSMDCPMWKPSTKNVKVIRKPRASEKICSTSPVPSNYVVTGYANSMDCLSWKPSSKNQKIIKRLPE